MCIWADLKFVLKLLPKIVTYLEKFNKDHQKIKNNFKSIIYKKVLI